MPFEKYQLYAILWLDRRSENTLTEFFCDFGIEKNCIQRGMHLTVYHSRKVLPNLPLSSKKVEIPLDLSETRFMVLAPGGENPKPNLVPKYKSVGIRLTKRNISIPSIIDIRESMIRHETQKILGTRRPSTRWASAFGARAFQPHIKLLRPGNNLDSDLKLIGDALRSEAMNLSFGKFTVKERGRK